MATPPPLPIPQQAEDNSPVATLLATLSNALPNMNAEVAHAIATTPGMTPDNALTTGQATQGFQEASHAVQQLQDQSPAFQANYWKTSTGSWQQMLRSAGFQPPHVSHGGGLFSHIGHALGTGVHDLLNVAGAPLRAEQHVERAVLAPPRSGAPAGFWGNLFSPQNWADAWDQTSNGNKYIMPSVENQVRRQYGDETYNLAYQLATGTDPSHLIQQANTQQAQDALAQRIGTDPELHAAVRALQDGKLSVGRMLAYNITSPRANPTLFHVVSGLTDGTLDWFGDPLVIGAKFGSIAKAAPLLVRDRTGVMWAYHSRQGVKNAMQFIADKVAAKDPYAITQVWPKLDPVIEGLMRERPSTADDVANFFGDIRNLDYLTRYNPGSLPGMAGGGWMPSLSTVGQMRLAMKGALQKSIDWMADGPAVVDGVQPGDLVPHALNGPIQRLQTNRGVQGIGQFLKKATTIAPPRGATFDAYDPHWLRNVSQISDMALPRAYTRDLYNRISQEANISQRKVMYDNMVKDLMARMGLGDFPAGQEFIKGFEESPSNPAFQSKYAPGEIDLLDTGHGPHPVGLIEPHGQTEWPVPDYRTLYAQAKKLGMTHALMGGVNNEMVDRFMQNAWKPLSLARIGFVLRVSGEEAFGAMLRYGPTALARAKLGALSVKQGNSLEPGNPILTPLAKTWGWLTQHLTPGQIANIKSGEDLVATDMGGAITRAMRNVEGALAGKEYTNAMRLGYRHGTVQRAFIDKVSAGHGAGFLDGDVLGTRLNQMVDHKLVPAVFRKTGSFKEYDHNAGAIFAPMWHEALQEISGSAWSRVAMETMDQPYVDRVNAVADAIERSPRMASRFPLNDQTTDGRLVAEGEATQREAHVDWARRIVDNVDANLRTPVGQNPKGMYDLGAHIQLTPDQTLADHLLNVGRPPSVPVLESIPDELRPLSVKGPAMMAVQRGGTAFFTKAITGMFDMIGRQIDWLSREPMWGHNFTKSLQAFGYDTKNAVIKDGLAAAWKRMGMSDAEVERHLVQAATDRAVEMTVPYIHNPELRSQFSQITRNLMPFWFAQEQFYKRWARNMAYSPWAFRQAQLINQGVQHSGFVHKDPTTGQEYFIYPGSSIVQDVLTRTLSAFGYKSWLPINAALRGQVNQASPGLERLGLPNYGPLVVIPLGLVKQVFPELTTNINAFEGQQAASAGFIRSLVPTTVVRIWQDATSSPSNSAQFASAMMQAIQYLEATGHGIGTVAINNLGHINVEGVPPTQAGLHPGDFVTNAHNVQYVYQTDGTWKRNDPAELAAFQQRVKNWTRVFLITRTLFGFVAPASPSGLFDPHHVNEDLQALLKTLPMEDALATFMKEHPDASAYTVFQSATQSGDPLPATKDAMAFLQANSGFMGNHPLAGAYFLPAVDSSGKFDLQTYQTQLAEQLRLKKTPAEFWKEIAYATAAKVYFAAEDRKNQLLNDPGSVGMTRTQVNQAWVQASQQFLQANPLFAAQLGVTPSTPGSLIGGESTTYSRADLLKDLHDALTDPSVPQTQQTADIRTLVNSYIALESMIAPYGAPGTPTMTSTQRYQIEGNYATQVTAWIAQHPDVQALYNRLIRPTLSSVLSSEAQVA